MGSIKPSSSSEDAQARLKRLGVKPGTTIYVNLRQVSRSGMSRHIEPFVIAKGKPVSIAYEVAAITGDRIAEDGGIVIGGAGMDMGFHLVYDLSAHMYPNGFRCTGKHCPANDHANPPHPPRDGRTKHRQAGGYALSHRWL